MTIILVLVTKTSLLKEIKTHLSTVLMKEPKLATTHPTLKGQTRGTFMAKCFLIFIMDVAPMIMLAANIEFLRPRWLTGSPSGEGGMVPLLSRGGGGVPGVGGKQSQRQG